MRKQWPLYFNDAVSIFQSWQGGAELWNHCYETHRMSWGRKKSAQSCTLAFMAREVHGREARASLSSLFSCPRESLWIAGFPPHRSMPWPCCASSTVGHLQFPNHHWHGSNWLSWRENGSTKARKQLCKWKFLELFVSGPSFKTTTSGDGEKR